MDGPAAADPEERVAGERRVADPVVAPPQRSDELLLNLFAGADPEPLVPARVAWYRRKLEELEAYLAAVKQARAGPARSGGCAPASPTSAT